MQLTLRARRLVSPTLHPSCPKCGVGMRLILIESLTPGRDKRSFECLGCGHAETTIVDYGEMNSAPSVVLG
jgi:hypothetical protein